MEALCWCRGASNSAAQSVLKVARMDRYPTAQVAEIPICSPSFRMHYRANFRPGADVYCKKFRALISLDHVPNRTA